MVFIQYSSFGQITKENNNNTHFVISTSGLHLRAGPSTHSEIIVSIPFGKTLRVLDAFYSKMDTLNDISFYYPHNNESYPVPVTGKWIKVKYKDYSGYVFDAYVYKNHNYHKLLKELNSEGLNKDVVLLFPGTWCNLNFWFNQELNWYGYYQDGDNFKAKKIDLSFFKIWNYDFTDIGISTNDNKHLLFIVGTRKKLKNENVIGKYDLNWWTKEFDSYDNINVQPGQNYQNLVLNDKGKEQILNLIPEYYLEPSNILWEGDLDEDGINDYIIHYGEKSGKTFLYLSSQAKDNQIVKPVAVFFSGYCC